MYFINIINKRFEVLCLIGVQYIIISGWIIKSNYVITNIMPNFEAWY